MMRARLQLTLNDGTVVSFHNDEALHRDNAVREILVELDGVTVVRVALPQPYAPIQPFLDGAFR